MFVKREASLDDLERLVEIHTGNFDPEEFSMKLGARAIRKFYQLAIASPDARVTVGADENGRLFCFSIGFTGYRAFQAELTRAMLVPIIIRIFSLSKTGRLKELLSILRYVTERPARIPLDLLDYHIGLIALDKHSGRSPAQVIFFYRLFGDTVDFVKSVSGGRCWTSAFEKNQASVRLINNVLRPNFSFAFRTRPQMTLAFLCSEPSSGNNG